MTDGHVAGSTWHVADVKRPLLSVAKMVAAGSRVHLDSMDPKIVRPKGDVIPMWKAGHVFVICIWVRKKRDQQEAGFSATGLSPEVRVTDERQTIRPVRGGGVARGRKMVQFDLGGVEDGQVETTWIARVMEQRTENVSGCCRGLAHPRKPSGSAMRCLTCGSGIGAGNVWLGGVLNVDTRSIQGTMIGIHLCALIMGI